MVKHHTKYQFWESSITNFEKTSRNFTLLQKTESVKKFKAKLFLFSNWKLQDSDDWRILYRKTKRCPLNITFLEKPL